MAYIKIGDRYTIRKIKMNAKYSGYVVIGTI